MEQANAPAFPTDIKLVNRNDEVTKAYWGPGLTKREYFAGLAMQGMLASYELQVDVQRNDPRYDGQNFAAVIAKNSIEFADALIAELEK